MSFLQRLTNVLTVLSLVFPLTYWYVFFGNTTSFDFEWFMGLLSTHLAPFGMVATISYLAGYGFKVWHK